MSLLNYLKYNHCIPTTWFLLMLMAQLPSTLSHEKKAWEIFLRPQQEEQFHLHIFCLQNFQIQLCGSQQTVENSGRDGNTRPPDLPLEKPVCRSGSNS